MILAVVMRCYCYVARHNDLVAESKCHVRKRDVAHNVVKVVSANVGLNVHVCSKICLFGKHSNGSRVEVSYLSREVKTRFLWRAVGCTLHVYLSSCVVDCNFSPYGCALCRYVCPDVFICVLFKFYALHHAVHRHVVHVRAFSLDVSRHARHVAPVYHARYVKVFGVSFSCHVAVVPSRHKRQVSCRRE